MEKLLKKSINIKASNTVKLMAFTALLGGCAGLIVWCFIKLISLCTELVWVKLPEMAKIPLLPLVFCVLGGRLMGMLHKRFGDYPEDLNTVMGKIQRDKHYDYHPMLVMLVCAFIPLVCGASVGPEAGLTGIIAALCYWVGDNVNFAKKNTDLFSQMGQAVILGQIFHSPLFGIIAVEEGNQDQKDSVLMTKGNKLLLYGIATGAAFFVAKTCGHFIGPPLTGFSVFKEVPLEKWDYLAMLIYIPAGLVAYIFFVVYEMATKAVAKRIPVGTRETICGLAIGGMALALPIVMFSGEEQMGKLIETFITYSPTFLIGICLVKLFMTSMCINFGMKGGHFFPLIFSCTSLGLALASMVFVKDPLPHAAFAAAVVTATMLGAQLKKPLAATLLLLLCFPATVIFWVFLCALLGKTAATQMEKLLIRRKGEEAAEELLGQSGSALDHKPMAEGQKQKADPQKQAAEGQKATEGQKAAGEGEGPKPMLGFLSRFTKKKEQSPTGQDKTAQNQGQKAADKTQPADKAQAAGSQSPITQGQQRIAQGQVQITQGQDRIVKGQQMKSKGQAHIMHGQELKEKGQTLITQGQAQIARGQAQIAQGQAQIAEIQLRLSKKQDQLAKQQASKIHKHDAQVKGPGAQDQEAKVQVQKPETQEQAQEPETQGQAQGPETQGQAQGPETQGQAQGPETQEQAQGPETQGQAQEPETQGQAQKSEAQAQTQGTDSQEMEVQAQEAPQNANSQESEIQAQEAPQDADSPEVN